MSFTLSFTASLTLSFTTVVHDILVEALETRAHAHARGRVGNTKSDRFAKQRRGQPAGCASRAFQEGSHRPKLLLRRRS